MKNILNNYKFIILTMWSYDKKYFIINLLITFLNSIFPIINIIFPKFIIDIITNNKNYEQLIVIIILWALADVAHMLITSKSNKFLSIRKDFLNNHFIMTIYKKMVDLDLDLLESPEIYKLKEKAIDVCNKKTGVNFCNRFFTILGNIITLMTSISLLSLANTFVFLILILVIIINTFLVIIRNKSQFTFWDKVSELNNESNYYFQLLSDPTTAKEMKLYSLSNWVINKYNMVKNKFFAAVKSLYNKIYNIEILKTTLSITQKSILYLYLGYEVIFNKMSLGNYTMLFGALNVFSSNITSVVNQIIQTIEDSIYLNSYINFIEIKNKIAVPDKTKLEVDDCKKFSIKLNNVNFTYRGSQNYVLNNINLQINCGLFYVIVGENGAGKTTLVNLLCRLYDPSNGTIELNSRNITDYNYLSYRDFFGVVFQDYKYYAFSIAENVALDKYNINNMDINGIRDALKQAGLEQKVNSLPNNIYTNLRKIFDSEGIELSGGESQKLAIAKALYKNAKVFVFDEPSSALDPYSENELINLFKSLSNKGKTVILISHRLSVCKYADEVIFMEKGKISAVGAHKELLNNPQYYEYYNKQAQHYN